MLIVAYKINEGLISNYEKENPANGVGCSGIIIILFTFLNYIIGMINNTIVMLENDLNNKLDTVEFFFTKSNTFYFR